ncbi:MAG: DUF4296 domain-containing protein [Lutimonas sp.]
MKKQFLAILVILLIISCESKVNYEKPEDLIPRETMIDLLYDMHLAVGTSNLRNKNNEKDRNYMSLVYEKYGIDSTRFAISNIYYTSQAVEYEEMFEEVERRLEVLHEQYENERDSAINASKRRDPLPKDSLRRVDEIEY